MSPPREEPVPPSERLKFLELRAQAVRARLTRAVDALDARRHRVQEVGTYAKQIAKPVALSTLGFVALFGGGVIAFWLSVRSRRSGSLSGRVSAVARRLDLVKTPSLAARIFERVVVTMVTFALTELLKRSAINLANGRLPDGRLMVGRALAGHHRRLASGTAP